MSNFTIHPLLVYSQHDVVPGHVCPVYWDLRESPDNARDIANPNPNEPLTFANLAQPATLPSLDSLDITCGLFSGDWPIKLRRPEGITVGDVLEAIHTTVTRRISHDEWNELSERQQERIKVVFDNRWKAAMDSGECRQNGVLRVDCLLQHTLFGGLSVSVETDNTCILTLRRTR
ncbi:ectomycorrhiza-regulated small secreted protein [Flammula alnicola]|nr:ectomycorrhiza-regulated small secreted protein [Flammula alnicola]